MRHVYGDILCPNTNEDQPVLIFNPVNTAGIIDSKLGKQIQKELPTIFEYYKTKCVLINAGCGELGDIQTICILADKGYLFANGFIFDAADGGKMSEIALRNTFRSIRMFFSNYTVRIPYMWGDMATSETEWTEAMKIIFNELVNANINVEIWHYTNGFL